MANFQLWYGGNRMGTRDLWASGSHGYWPNSPASATDQYAYGFSGHQSDGRSFFAERHFIPDEQGDSALFGYLQREVDAPAVGDSLHLMLIPRGCRLDTVSLTAIAVPVGFEANLIRINLATSAETTITTLGVADIGVPKTVAINLAAGNGNPMLAGNVNHMLALKITAVPAGWAVPGTVDWSKIRFELNASGQDNLAGHPLLDASQVTV